MSAWTCPDCHRIFARRQSHECSPAVSVDEYFSTGPAFERPIFEAVTAHLRTLGDIHVEPVSVGIFLKRDGASIVQLRTMTRWVALHLVLPSRIDHPRIARKPLQSGHRWWHVVNIRDADDVDGVVTEWITLAWESCVQ